MVPRPPHKTGSTLCSEHCLTAATWALSNSHRRAQKDIVRQPQALASDGAGGDAGLCSCCTLPENPDSALYPGECLTTLVAQRAQSGRGAVGPVPAVPLLQRARDLQRHPRVHRRLCLDDRLRQLLLLLQVQGLLPWPVRAGGGRSPAAACAGSLPRPTLAQSCRVRRSSSYPGAITPGAAVLKRKRAAAC